MVRNSLVPFILLSSAFHLLLVASWYARYDQRPVMQDIPIRVIPAPPEAPPVNPQLSREAPALGARPSAQLAKNSPPAASAAQILDKSLPKLAERDYIPEKPPVLKPRRMENETIITAPLPTLKELLPPAYTLRSEENWIRRSAIPLDSQEPRYVSYLTSVKQAIEVQWIYPTYGLKGKVRVELTIRSDGRLEDIHVVRSSGSEILDNEALRATRAAAPFRPLPSSMGERQSFTGSFEY